MTISRLPIAFCLGLYIVLCCRASGEEREHPEQIAQQIRIPRLEFREATLREAIDFLQQKARQLLEEGRTLNILYAGRAPLGETRLTLSYQDVPLLEVLEVIAHQAGLEIGATNEAIYLFPPGELRMKKQGRRKLELSWSGGTTKLMNQLIYAYAQREAFVEARRNIEDTFGENLFNAPKETRAVLDRLRKRIEDCDNRIQELNRMIQKNVTEPSDAESNKG